MADAVPLNTKEDFCAMAASRGLVGAANNAKWNELISFMRALSDWKPSCRSKSVTGQISKWDVEWFYHLPFPFVGAQWLDIGLHEHATLGGLVPPKITDHSAPIISELRKIGLEFEVCGGVVRIWGYLPRCLRTFRAQRFNQAPQQHAMAGRHFIVGHRSHAVAGRLASLGIRGSGSHSDISMYRNFPSPLVLATLLAIASALAGGAAIPSRHATRRCPRSPSGPQRSETRVSA